MTFNDYKKALKGAGPKLTEQILQRAIRDPEIRFGDMVRLEKYAEDKP